MASTPQRITMVWPRRRARQGAQRRPGRGDPRPGRGGSHQPVHLPGDAPALVRPRPRGRQQRRRHQAFVGCTPVAWHVYETGTRHGKRVQARGGAKYPMLVLPDADLVARIGARVHGLRTGDGTRGCDLGPLVTAAHLDRVRGYVVTGGRAWPRAPPWWSAAREGEFDAEGAGFFYGPTSFDHVGPRMSIDIDEIFGPVLPVVRLAASSGRSRSAWSASTCRSRSLLLLRSLEEQPRR